VSKFNEADAVLIETAADLTPAAWEALEEIYNRWFGPYLYVNFPEMWDVLAQRGYVMAALDAPAASVIIADIEAHRDRERAERRRLRWYHQQP